MLLLDSFEFFCVQIFVFVSQSSHFSEIFQTEQTSFSNLCFKFLPFPELPCASFLSSHFLCFSSLVYPFPEPTSFRAIRSCRDATPTSTCGEIVVDESLLQILAISLNSLALPFPLLPFSGAWSPRAPEQSSLAGIPHQHPHVEKSSSTQVGGEAGR